MATFIYVISGEHGRQKIGVSDDPKRRIAELQTGSPYTLKFEFIGEVAEGGAGAVEVESHFMLNRHKAPGGDEWFVVPPDVAVTAVMAAAHRIGYRIRPVDPDGVPSASVQVGTPTWHHGMTVAAAIPMFAGFAWLVSSYEAGKIGGVAFALASAILIGGFKLLRMALIQGGETIQWVGRKLPD